MARGRKGLERGPLQLDHTGHMAVGEGEAAEEFVRAEAPSSAISVIALSNAFYLAQ